MNSHITHRTKRFEIFIYFVIIGFLFFPPNVSANKIPGVLNPKNATTLATIVREAANKLSTEMRCNILDSRIRVIGERHAQELLNVAGSANRFR